MRDGNRQNELYTAAVEQHGDALARLARGYEADEHKREDLVQEIHLQLWRSLTAFDGRCSLRTWAYRVAHNTAASHVVREARHARRFLHLEEIDLPAADAVVAEAGLDRARQLEWLAELVRRLQPLDRQVILCYLEGLDARAIGEVTGLSAAAIGMKIHRIKRAFGRQAQEAARDGE